MYEMFQNLIHPPTMDAAWIAALVSIIGVDLLLSGDNSIVIGLVASELPDRLRNKAIFIGTAVAILMRIVLALFASVVIQIPYLSILGGVVLFYVAVKLVTDHADKDRRKAPPTLGGAIRVIAIADLSMSIDNVLAMAGISKSDPWLMIIGVAVSIIFMLVGAKLVTYLIDRFPILPWFGAGLLGWVAGGIIAGDPYAKSLVLPGDWTLAHYVLSVFGAVLVVLLGLALPPLLAQIRDRRERVAQEKKLARLHAGQVD